MRAWQGGMKTNGCTEGPSYGRSSALKLVGCQDHSLSSSSDSFVDVRSITLVPFRGLAAEDVFCIYLLNINRST